MPQNPESGPHQPDFGPQQPQPGGQSGPQTGPQQPPSGPQTGPQQPPSSGPIPQGYPITPQFIIIPYLLPVAGVPGNCPCYYMESQNNGTGASQGSQPSQAVAQPAPQAQQQPIYGQPFAGQFAVVLYPTNCQGNGYHVQQQIQQMFTGAMPVPYSCDACAAQQQAQNNQRPPQVRRRGGNRRRRISTGSK